MDAKPNVLLFVLDTLRADAVDNSDDPFDVATPTFDEMAASGTTFDNAFAVGPWTPPSHGALFSGRYPSETGFDGAWPTMPADVPLLAEWFRDAGYRTYGIPGPAKMGSATGLDRGFDEYYEVYEEVAERPSLAYLKQLLTDSEICRDFVRTATEGNDYYTEIKFDRLRQWLGAHDRPTPFFAMANLTTVHAPYNPPRPYKKAATPELSRPRFGLVEELADDLGTFDDDAVDDERLFEVATGGHATSTALRYHDDPSWLSERELEVVRSWYGASIRYLDDRLSAFFDWFEAAGLDENTVVVLTSDHGELFGEHDLLYHGNFLYEELTKVPLVLAGPGIPSGERRSELASHVDLFATLCDVCGLDAPSTAGSSLFESRERDAVFAAEAPSSLADEPAADEVSTETVRAFESGRKSIRTEHHRFERRSDGTELLYELPEEVVIEDPDDAIVDPLRERLVDVLGSTFDVHEDGADADYSDGVERNLRRLGYLE